MPADSHDPATSGPRYRATTGGHGNAEPHDEPRRVWTAADVAEFNAGVIAARHAYYEDPLAALHAANDNNRARKRMAAIRAERKAP